MYVTVFLCPALHARKRKPVHCNFKGHIWCTEVYPGVARSASDNSLHSCSIGISESIYIYMVRSTIYIVHIVLLSV